MHKLSKAFHSQINVASPVAKQDTQQFLQDYSAHVFRVTGVAFLADQCRALR